jgi:hypothetical protein
MGLQDQRGVDRVRRLARRTRHYESALVQAVDQANREGAPPKWKTKIGEIEAALATTRAELDFRVQSLSKDDRAAVTAMLQEAAATEPE